MSVPSWQRLIGRQRLWLLAALLLAMTLAYVSDILGRIDLSIYDTALPGGAAPADVIIVAVDDASIAELGRWPWPRSRHAALLDQLRNAGARAVALDLLLTESDPDSPTGDAALATAMSRGLPTVLPSFADIAPGKPARERLPIPLLARAAAGIGHSQLEIDPDGIVRSVFLLEGPGAPSRPYLAAALLASTPGEKPVKLSGARHPDVIPAAAAWVRDYRILIPFLGPPGHFQQVAYVDVLRGKVPAAVLRGKIVLAGVTAQGVGDELATPLSGHSRPMPGVEVMANILQGLRSESTIRPVGKPMSIFLGVIPVLLVAFGLQRLGPRQSLLLVVGLWFGTLGGAMLAMRVGWWWPPTATLAALLSAYPLWSWQRLETTQAFLEEQFVQIARERFPLLRDLPAATNSDDFVERRIDLLRQATERLRAVQREREDVVRFLSHDMKSPATSLLGLAQLQRDPARALPPQELSQRLDLLAQRMLALLDSFVALARAEAADPAAFGTFDLRDSVQDAYDEVWAAAQARNITITPRLPDDACWVSGDRQLLARAVVNLLGNAVKYSLADSAVVLSCAQRDGCNVVGVIDNGPGIEPAQGAALFQRFSRGLHRGGMDPGGAGLGLAFVRVVAEKHGGQISAAPNPESGTIFELILPALAPIA